MTLGFGHGELATLLWGALFGLLVLYSLVLSLLLRLHTPALKLETAVNPSPLEPTTFVWTTPPVATPPLFVWSVRLVAVHSPDRHASARFDLAKGEGALALARGSYNVEARVELRDLWGLTLWRPRAVTTLVAKVPAQPLSNSPPLPTARPTELSGPRQAVRRSGEAFDVRPYQPGDDLRRLHWPLWAHSGQTWLRIPDLTPPPTGLGVWLVDVSVAPDTAAADREAVLDVRAGCLAAWLKPDEAWTVQVPAFGWSCSVPAELGGFLARLTVAADLPEPGERWLASLPTEVLVVTGEGSPGLASLRARLEPRVRVKPVLVPLPLAGVPSSHSWWKRR